MVKICIFERSNEKNHFSKTKIYFHKKATPQLLGHIGLQNMKVYLYISIVEVDNLVNKEPNNRHDSEFRLLFNFAIVFICF